MKKILCYSLIWVITAITILPFGGSASANGANSEISVTIDDRPVYFDVAPQKINGRVMVPLRAIFEGLGASVGWEAATETITGKKGNTEITLRLNEKEAKVNGESVQLDSPAIKVGGRTLVPARFVAESLGADVKWDETLKRVIISTGAEAPDGVYYFVYNSQRVTDADSNAIKQNMNKFADTRNVLFDASGFNTASKLYDALKAEQKKLGGKVAGIQIFGLESDVPSFPYIHKMKVMEANSNGWDGITHNKNEKFVTDFFYSTFKNDSKYLRDDVTVYGIIQENLPISIVPEWPVSRLPLTRGEIASYVERYEDYRKQIENKSVPNIVLSAPNLYPSGFPEGAAEDDVAFFMKRLKEEFGLFKNITQRSYYKDLVANLAKENKSGIMDLTVSSFYSDDAGTYMNKADYQNNSAFLDRKSVSGSVNSNYYTAFFWGVTATKDLGTDNLIHDGLTKGKMINPISHTARAGNGGVANYVWAQVDETEDGQPLFWYVPVSYEDIQNSNSYYFVYLYYAGLDEGKTRLQSFHDAKVEYANMSVNNKKNLQAAFGFENVISLHYLGLADY